jgi:hypothetical protein
MSRVAIDMFEMKELLLRPNLVEIEKLCRRYARMQALVESHPQACDWRFRMVGNDRDGDSSFESLGHIV